MVISMLSMLLFFASSALAGYLVRYFMEANRLKKEQLSIAFAGSVIETTSEQYVQTEKTVVAVQEDAGLSNVLVDEDGTIYRLECENNNLKKQLKQLNEQPAKVVEKKVSEDEGQLQNLEETVKNLLNEKQLLTQRSDDLSNTIGSLESQFRDLFEKSSAQNNANKQLESKVATTEAALEEQLKINEQLRNQTDELYEKLNKKTKPDSLPVEKNSLLKGIGNLQDPVHNLSGNVKEQMTKLREAEKHQVEEKAVRGTVVKNRSNQLIEVKQASEILGVKVKLNDLKLVEGIGPKIEDLFHKAGIKTWQELADTSVEQCREILQKGGERFQMHNPTTWPKQCKLLAAGKWKQLKEYQLSLDGGRVTEK